MGKAGPSFYDDEMVFATYMRHRHRLDAPNETLEKPVILELVAPITNKQFVFSVGHPVITSCDRGWVDGTPRQDWVVDNYFSTGVRVTD
nr:hypothetical protein [Oculatella sp. FACHB-28]